MEDRVLHILKKGEAKAFQIKAERFLRIECLDDEQLADLTFEGYNQGITLDTLRRFHLIEGNLLFNGNEEPMIKVIKISSRSKTNILFRGCKSSVYSRFERKKLGCRELIARELDLPTNELPSTINLFMDFELDVKQKTFRTVKPKVKSF